MRQPDVNILQAVIAALPDDRLRPLLLELLGATPAVPAASAPITPDAAATTTPAAAAATAKNRGGRPPGSHNKAKAVETGAAKAAALAALPGRAEMVAAVAAGKMTQAEAARRLNTTPKTVASWVERFRREQQEQEPAAASGSDQATAAPSRPPGPAGETPAQRTARLAKHAAAQRARDAVRRRLRDADRTAKAAQMGLPIEDNGDEDIARVSISAARPTLTKTGIDPDPAEAALAAKLWARAAQINPANPHRPIASEFNLNAALALDHYRSSTMPPIAPAAAARFIEAA
jgi:transposase